MRKFGFRFFFSEGREDLDQLHRARRERAAADAVVAARPRPLREFPRRTGARARRRSSSTARWCARSSLSTDDAPHAVGFERGGASHTISARWVVDAAGRAGLIKRKLDLAQANDHDANAVWWRVDGYIEPQQWSDDPAWLGALQSAGALAFDQPHVRPGLLVLADPAGLERAFAGHRLRREDASARHDEHARQGDGLAAHAPAAASRVRSTSPNTRCRTSCSSATSPTAASRCSPATAGR